ncbi:hypothetical protein F5880DRAFT_1473708 [Lentinula raphanica]|nr:hypothetical protein F5880DRAFT_1473708 [Lentinula raphanica]
MIIDPDFLRWAYGRRTTTSGIAYFLNVSRRTVRRSLLEYGIVSPGRAPRSNNMDPNVSVGQADHNFDPSHLAELPQEVQDAANLIQSSSSSAYLSNMSNNDLDTMIQLLRSHYPGAGIRMLDGMLRRLGQVLPYERIQQSLTRLEPVSRVFDRIRIRRRRYTVPGPNSLWHHNGHHRKHSCLSVHNVRIERLWVDVSNSISQHWNNHFTLLESNHSLDVDNSNHIWLLQHLFLNTINHLLAFWAQGWNNHRITQRDGPNRSPEDMWGFDMFVHGLRGNDPSEFTMTDEELENFGIDWEGLQDDTLLQSLRRNYDHEEADGASTWLGRHGPPPTLNEVRVDPPTGLMTTEDVQALDESLWSINRTANEGDVVYLWSCALAFARGRYPDAF